MCTIVIDNYKTKMCSSNADNQCKYGVACANIHEEYEKKGLHGVKWNQELGEFETKTYAIPTTFTIGDFMIGFNAIEGVPQENKQENKRLITLITVPPGGKPFESTNTTTTKTITTTTTNTIIINTTNTSSNLTSDEGKWLIQKSRRRSKKT